LRRACIALALTAKALATARFSDREVHEVTYLAQKLLNFNLGYRFAWLAGGPRSKALAAELRAYASVCADTALGGEAIDAAARRLRSLIEEVAGATNLHPRRALDLISSYVMLAYDVYPRPDDVVAEVLRVRRWARRRDVEVAAAAVGRLVKAGRAVGAGAS